MGLFNSIFQLGVRKEMSAEDEKYTRLTNILNLSTIFIISIPAILAITYSPFPHKGQASLIRFELLILFSILNLYLNARGLYLLCKMLTVLMPYILIFLLPIFNKFMHPGMLIWMPYGIMIMGSYSFSLFSLKKEKVLLIAMMFFFGFSSAFYDNVFTRFAEQSVDLSFFNQYYIVYKLTIILLPSLLYINLYMLKQRNFSIQSELDHKNELLLKLNEKLEEQVIDRTKKIEKQNQRIKDLAYTNSHRLRAFGARILGLSHILEFSKDEKEKNFCVENIVHSAKEIDVCTRVLSEKLEEKTESDEEYRTIS